MSAKDKKCLHYYFYFIDSALGLCYLRVPAWCPFRLQFYCNPHNWLARQLDQAGVPDRQLDNAFIEIGDWKKAQEISDSFDAAWLHPWHAEQNAAGAFAGTQQRAGIAHRQAVANTWLGQKDAAWLPVLLDPVRPTGGCHGFATEGVRNPARQHRSPRLRQ